MWKVVETKSGETRIAKAERKRGKRGSRKKQEKKEKKKKQKEKTIDIKKIVEEWEIWDEKEEEVRLEEEAKKLVPEKFHK